MRRFLLECALPGTEGQRRWCEVLVGRNDIEIRIVLHRNGSSQPLPAAASGVVKASMPDRLGTTYIRSSCRRFFSGELLRCTFMSKSILIFLFTSLLLQPAISFGISSVGLGLGY
jgi:hypothetical protein